VGLGRVVWCIAYVVGQLGTLGRRTESTREPTRRMRGDDGPKRSPGSEGDGEVNARYAFCRLGGWGGRRASSPALFTGPLPKLGGGPPAEVP